MTRINSSCCFVLSFSVLSENVDDVEDGDCADFVPLFPASGFPAMIDLVKL